jgi:hypothetical protein
MPAVMLLSFVAILLSIAGLAAAIGRSVGGVPIVYGLSFAVCLAAGAVRSTPSSPAPPAR